MSLICYSLPLDTIELLLALGYIHLLAFLFGGAAARVCRLDECALARALRLRVKMQMLLGACGDTRTHLTSTTDGRLVRPVREENLASAVSVAAGGP